MSFPCIRNQKYLFRILTFVLFVTKVQSLRLPGPRVYVVTPATNPLKIDESGSPSLNHESWRRADQKNNHSNIMTKLKPKTPDLIFADFESGHGSKDAMEKSIRKLLENERIRTTVPTTSTTKTPDLIFAEFESEKNKDQLEPPKSVKSLLQKERVIGYSDIASNSMFDTKHQGMDDYLSLYGNIYDISTTSTPKPIFNEKITTAASTQPQQVPMQVEDVWHIINNEQSLHNTGKWEEVPISTERTSTESNIDFEKDKDFTQNDDGLILSGLTSNGEQLAENESRAIRTDSNLKFPYINLKTYQMNNSKKNMNSISKKKQTNNNFASLDNFKELSHPVRGEAQDYSQYSYNQIPKQQQIDRYNSAQPYFPPDKEDTVKPIYQAPGKATSNLIPPPPPPPPPKQAAGDVLSPPDDYESFPPFPPASDNSLLPTKPAQSPKKPPIVFQDSSSNDASDFDSVSDPDSSEYPTLSEGYQYSKPAVPAKAHEIKPEYYYSEPATPTKTYESKPEYHYSKPQIVYDGPVAPPDEDKSPPSSEVESDSPHGYDYSKPSYYSDDHDFPEPVSGKGHKKKMKNTNVMAMGMKPPPPPAKDDMQPDLPPLISHDSDIPSLKHHGYGDYYPDHHHHHEYYEYHPTTTTTTTEMPRVNRFSYYYLGKKLYYLPLYFSVYFVVYVGALIIKAVLRHKIVYPNSWKPFNGPADGFNKRSVENDFNLSGERMQEISHFVANSIMKATEKYMPGGSTNS